jgi:hypothetical protein
MKGEWRVVSGWWNVLVGSEWERDCGEWRVVSDSGEGLMGSVGEF